MDFAKFLTESKSLSSSLFTDENIANIDKASNICVNAIKNNKKLFFCGNGGSAADSQHFAAEIVCRFIRNRMALPAIALCTDTSVITSIANDYGFEFIFSRQLEALANQNDVLIAISTSGKSLNIIEAIKKAKSMNLKIIILTGQEKTEIDNLCDLSLKVKSNSTPIIQQGHLFFGHAICLKIENSFFRN